MKLLLLDRPADKDIAKKRYVEFFGPWAQPINSFEDLNKPVFEVYTSPEAVYKASLRSMNVANELLKSLSEIMPLLTGVKKGTRFWRILLGHHIIAISGMVEDIYMRLKSLPDSNYILGLPEFDYGDISVPLSWNDAQSLIFFDDHFKWKLMSLCLMDRFDDYELVKYKKVNFERTTNRFDDLKSKFIQNDLSVLWGKMIQILKTRFALQKPMVRRNSSEALLWDRYQLRNLDFNKLVVAVINNHCFTDHDYLNSALVDNERRKRVKSALSHPYGELVSMSLPLVSLERLPHLAKCVEDEIIQSFEMVGRVYTHGQAFLEDGVKRVLLAQLADDGKQIISVQHGGGGVYYAHSWMFLEKVIADEHISWGRGYSQYKELKNSNRSRFLPSIYLSDLKQRRLTKKNIKKKWDVLFVVLEENRYIKWLYSPLFPDMAYDYFKRQKTLFDYYCKNYKTAVKVYPFSCGWKQTEWIKTKYPCAKILRSGLFTNYAMQSKMVIVDYNSTAVFEMLVSGMPFLATWNRRWFRGVQLFEELLDKLIEVGVFFEDPKELIRVYGESVNLDVESWWNESKSQDVLKEMADNFAMTSNNVYEIWNREFDKKELYRG